MTKLSFVVSIRTVRRSPSPSLHATNINERADFKGLLGLSDGMSGHLGREEERGGKKKRSAILLSLAPSLPLRADRSFDRGSKFTLQTCWEAGERRTGKASSALQGPGVSAGQPVRNTKAGNKFVFFSPPHSCGGEMSAAAPRLEASRAGG